MCICAFVFYTYPDLVLSLRFSPEQYGTNMCSGKVHVIIEIYLYLHNYDYFLGTNKTIHLQLHLLLHLLNSTIS